MTHVVSMADFTGLLAPKLYVAGANVRESWQTFKQQFNMYLLASGSTVKSNTEKIAMLLTFGGSELLNMHV